MPRPIQRRSTRLRWRPRRGATGFSWHRRSRARFALARRNAAQVEAARAELRKLVPSGVPISESNYFEKDWQQALWGPNHLRPGAVKDKYDPDGLFFVHRRGQQVWSADG